MIGCILLTILAAMGLLSLGWVLLGWLLPGGRGCALVCYGTPDEGILARWKWLQSMGWLRCPLICVTEQADLTEGTMEICAGEQLLCRLERERMHCDGTGNGDPTGRHQRRGISEL